MTRNLSIIIPTLNRKSKLLLVLDGYNRQTARDQILEVLVVDDGSTDGTREAVLQSANTVQIAVRYLRQEWRGLAAARNHGIREARGAIILFGDDDIIPDAKFVSEHLAWHVRYPALPDAVVGCLTWSPDVNPTPFMEWLEHDTNDRRSEGLLDDPFLLGGFTSLKREFLIQNGTFDEDFKAYGLEDIELGRRLLKKGMRVFYNPSAVGYHYKRMSVADVWRREELVEKALPLFRAKMGYGEPPNPFRNDGSIKKALRKLVRAVLPAAAPVLWLFDTQIPLPSIVYQVFYYHYIVPTARARVRAEIVKAVPPLSKAQQGAE